MRYELALSSIQSIELREYFGKTGSLSVKTFPYFSIDLAKLAISGHGDSGFTWSGVNGDIPPQSLIPESKRVLREPEFKLGGVWMFIL